MWEHLGDGVYCRINDFAVYLRINSHENAASEIILESFIWESLVKKVEKHNS